MNDTISRKMAIEEIKKIYHPLAEPAFITGVECALEILRTSDLGSNLYNMKDRLFIRLGNIPENFKSINHREEVEEPGVSVYNCIMDDNNGEFSIILPSKLRTNSLVSLSGCLRRPMFIVTGTVIGIGSDGEPLLGEDIKIVKELPAPEPW